MGGSKDEDADEEDANDKVDEDADEDGNSANFCACVRPQKSNETPALTKHTFPQLGYLHSLGWSDGDEDDKAAEDDNIDETDDDEDDAGDNEDENSAANFCACVRPQKSILTPALSKHAFTQLGYLQCSGGSNGEDDDIDDEDG